MEKEKTFEYDKDNPPKIELLTPDISSVQLAQDIVKQNAVIIHMNAQIINFLTSPKFFVEKR